MVPATSDLATQQALQIAAELDPQGERTIGVITKVDILNSPEDLTKLREILEGNNQYVRKLKLGCIGVSAYNWA